MTVCVENGTIVLSGNCPSGDAEELLQLLLGDFDAAVDWRSCTAAHTAVIQVLLAARRDILGPPRSALLDTVVAPALARWRQNLAFGTGSEMRNSR